MDELQAKGSKLSDFRQGALKDTTGRESRRVIVFPPRCLSQRIPQHLRAARFLPHVLRYRGLLQGSSSKFSSTASIFQPAATTAPNTRAVGLPPRSAAFSCVLFSHLQRLPPNSASHAPLLAASRMRILHYKAFLLTRSPLPLISTASFTTAPPSGARPLRAALQPPYASPSHLHPHQLLPRPPPVHPSSNHTSSSCHRRRLN
ncbi:hypothetical protein L210DRAFT_935203 [Boletus edulis BED1]|uniref:Uncharacterized protein n=1 Tax=Boletus edulis BED1 TaxID=1328754 RepID=A0AAD4G7M7_BOLED|nr:hypothetical protein L210DRAFT_935203 [Boletus edulis BED1]